MTRTVAIIQRRMTHYRIPLFQQLRERLAEQDIHLRVLHGTPTASEGAKKDSGALPWAEELSTSYLARDKICWQPFTSRVRDCDLVVVTQENKLINNLPPLVGIGRPRRVAFWGHGRDMQASNPDSLAERFKRWTTRRVDWWFAYTEMSAGFVRAAGFPGDRITVLNNSIDTSELLTQVRTARLQDRTALRESLGLPAAAQVGVFIGSLYPEKRIPWLLEAAKRIRRSVPNFHLLIAGAGPEAHLVTEAKASSSAISYVGVVRGVRKAELLAAADAMINPGLVGLSILDAFVAGLPMLTTDCGLHSPEIAYLEHGHNGLMTVNDMDCYVETCAALLTNPEQLYALQSGALRSSTTYSIKNMADRFSNGILQSIAS